MRRVSINGSGATNISDFHINYLYRLTLFLRRPSSWQLLVLLEDHGLSIQKRLTQPPAARQPSSSRLQVHRELSSTLQAFMRLVAPV